VSLWRHLSRGIHVLTHRRRVDKDVADEVEHYLEQATASRTANGLSPQDARRAARLELGSHDSVREEIRAYGWEHTLRTYSLTCTTLHVS
jgi:putative ABC transport system permease protein